MEFKLPKLANNGRRGGQNRSESGFGSLTPRTVLSAISKSLAEGQLEYVYSDPGFNGFSGYEIDSASRTLLFPMAYSSERAMQKLPAIDSQFSVTNQGLNRVYSKLSRLELEQTESQSSQYKMPRRAPRRAPRKHFDVSSYAKNFMRSVADATALPKSRTNVVKDFTLGRQQLDNSSQNSLDFLTATSISDMLQNSKSNKTLPVPASSPSEQGRMLLPAMRPKGKKIMRGDPSFMNRTGSTAEMMPSTSSLQSFRMTIANPSNCGLQSVPHFTHIPSNIKRSCEILDEVKEHNSKREYLNFTANSSTQNLKMYNGEILCDFTKRNYDAKDEKVGKKCQKCVDNLQDTGKIRHRKDKTVTEVITKTDGVVVEEDDSKMEISYKLAQRQGLEHAKSPSDEEFFSAEEILPSSTVEISAKDGERKFPKRRKLDTSRYRLPKAQMTDEALQAAFDAKHGNLMSSSVSKLLPPISTSDLLVSPSKFSSSSLLKLRAKGSTDADDELENNSQNYLSRPKRYRKQPQYHSSGSETEDLCRRKAAKRRKRRKRPSRSTTTVPQTNTKSQTIAVPQRENRREPQNKIGEAGEITDITRHTYSTGPKEKNLRNTTSESIISRYITDLTKRGHIVTSDPEDGDDELEDDDYDFSKVSLS